MTCCRWSSTFWVNSHEHNCASRTLETFLLRRCWSPESAHTARSLRDAEEKPGRWLAAAARRCCLSVLRACDDDDNNDDDDGATVLSGALINKRSESDSFGARKGGDKGCKQRPWMVWYGGGGEEEGGAAYSFANKHPMPSAIPRHAGRKCTQRVPKRHW